MDFRSSDPFDLSSDAVSDLDAIPFHVEEASPGASAPKGRARRGALDKKGQYVVPGFRDSLHERKRAVKWAWGRVLENTAIGRCGRVAGNSWQAKGVTVVPLVKSWGSARPVGVVQCHNKHTCPDCGPKADRASRESLAAVIWEEQQRGAQVGMITLTFAHQLGERLIDLIGWMLPTVTKVLSGGGNQMKALREKYGFSGGYKAVEANHSMINGWHPHIHMPVFFEPGTTDEQVAECANEIIARWLRQCEKAGVKAERQRQHYRPADLVTQGQGLANYVAKTGIQWEATSRSTKRGRGNSRSIFQIAEDYAEHQWPGDRDLMLEWDEAMKGTKRITPFGEIRKRYAGRIKTEWEETFHGEENEAREDEEVCAIEADVYNAICAEGGYERLMDAAEVGIVAVKAVLHDYGFSHGLWPPGVAERVRRRKPEAPPESEEGTKEDDED